MGLQLNQILCASFFLFLFSMATPSAGAQFNKTSVGDLPTPVPEDCLGCICFVESDCEMPDPVCEMDFGSLSCGPFQIKKPYWNDATLKGGYLDGSWRTCTKSMACSKQCVQGYMARYAVSSRLKRQPTCEDFARIHNGGPNGYKNPTTLEYWYRVKKCLEKGYLSV